MESRTRRLAAVALVSIASFLLVAAAETESDGYWPQWRGPTATGAAEQGSPPTSWSESKNVRWKVDIPGLGTSSPIVWKDRVFVTTAIPSAETSAPSDQRSEQDRRMNPSGKPPGQVYEFALVALARSDGRELWRQIARAEQPHEGTHPDGTFASGSPVTDGEHVFAFFGSRGLYAYDMDGEPVWQRDLGDMTVRLGFGEGSSPSLAGDRLIVNWDHEGDSFIVALDKRTGEEIWRRDRDEETSWTTPLIVEHAGRHQVVVSATRKIRAYDLATGDPIWEATGMTLNAIPSPVHADGVVYLTSGFRGNALMAVRLDGARGDVTGTDRVLWQVDRDTPYVPSPLLYRDRLYVLKSNKGLLSVYNVESGELSYGVQRLDAVRNIYASPVGVDGRVYFLGRDGGALVIEHGDSFKVIAENALEDRFDASPAIVGDEIYLRGRRSLYCIATG